MWLIFRIRRKLYQAVLRIRDVYPGSPQIRIFSIPDPGSASKEFKYINPQKIVSKLSEIWSGIVHPGSGSWFFTHPGSWFFTHPGSRGQKGTGSRIRNTDISTGKRKKRLYNRICKQGRLPYLAVRTRLSQVRCLPPWWRPRAACWRPGGGTPGGAGASADREWLSAPAQGPGTGPGLTKRRDNDC